MCSPPFSVSITWIRKAKHLFQTETLYLAKKKIFCASCKRTGLNVFIRQYQKNINFLASQYFKGGHPCHINTAFNLVFKRSYPSPNNNTKSNTEKKRA
jgi:hypothetical protein